MIVRFTTETGSVYEVSPSEKKARRVSGTKNPTPRFGGDEWRTFEAMAVPALEVEIGEPLIFHWQHDSRPDDVRLKDHTMTSPVTSIEYIEG